MKSHLPALVFLFLIASCGKPESEGGDTSSEPEESAKPWDWIPEDPDLLAGRIIYLRECSLCHDEGEESAPPLTRRDEWEDRAAKGESTLIRHATEGFRGDDGKMPARGGTETLSDPEVANAVRYMIATPK